MHTKKRRQRRSKRKGGQGHLLRSSARSSRASARLTRSSRASARASSHCDKKLMDMFKKYNTSRYRSALDTVIRELLKYNPLAIIEFIETHFNETSILAHFNNEKCIKIQLDTLKRQLHEYKQKIVKTKTNTYEKFTMKSADSILKKGYATFSKLRGGAPGDESEEAPAPEPAPAPAPPEEPICSVCLEELVNGREIIVPNGCIHRGHAHCLRTWWRIRPTCPECRGEGDLPPPSPEELEERRQHPEEDLSPEDLLRMQEEHEEQQMQRQRAARRQTIMRRRLAYALGVCGVAFYNLEYVMDVTNEAARMVDPTMSGLEMTMDSFVLILMLILSTLGIVEQFVND